MSKKLEQSKDIIINAVVNKIEQEMEANQAKLCSEFVRQFYGTVALDDLNEWEIEDLYGAAANFWALIKHRAPNEIKIKIYNPDFERHGWQTTHTVVEVICDDMPFLVDSLRLVVNRMDLVSHLIIHMGGMYVERNKDNDIVKILPRSSDLPKGTITEAPIFMEVDRQTDIKVLEELQKNLERTLSDNRAVVEDWLPMREKVREIITELDSVSAPNDENEVEETKELLKWLEDHHFTF